MILERSRPLKWVFRRYTQLHVRVYRLTKGRVGAKWRGGLPILLMDHVGRKSGKLRTSPLVYTPHGEEDLVVVASFGGADRDPVWWVNLKANPRTSVDVGGDRRAVAARLAAPRRRLRCGPS